MTALDFQINKDSIVNHQVYGLCKIKGVHARKKWINGLDLIPLDNNKLNQLIKEQNQEMTKKGWGMAHMTGWFFEADFSIMKIAA